MHSNVKGEIETHVKKEFMDGHQAEQMLSEKNLDN